MRTSTSPGPGFGVGSSPTRITSGLPVVSMNAALMGFDSCVTAAQKACLRGGRSHYNTVEGLIADSESSPLVPAPPSLVSRDNPFPFRRNFLMAQVLTSAPGGLAVSERVEERLRSGELTQAQVDDFREFLAEVDRVLL